MFSMKTVAAVAVAFPLLLAATSASADIKIAVIRAADLVQNSPQYTAAAGKIKTEFQKRKDDLDTKAKKLADDFKTYQKNADVMSPEDRVKKENDLLTRRNDLKYQEAKFKSDFQRRDAQLTKSMMTKIKGVITKIAKEKGYDLVLQDPVYMVPSMDITDEVLADLKKSGN